MKDYKVDERSGSQYSFNFDNDENPTIVYCYIYSVVGNTEAKKIKQMEKDILRLTGFKLKLKVDSASHNDVIFKVIKK